MLKKSPSGSLCPYHYKGGILQPLHYGGYGQDLARFEAVLQEEEAFILQSHGGRKVWIDLYETHLNGDMMDVLLLHLSQVARRIDRLALVGCGRLARFRLHRALKDHPWLRGRVAFFEDPEIAKDWLVGIQPNCP